MGYVDFEHMELSQQSRTHGTCVHDELILIVNINMTTFLFDMIITKTNMYMYNMILLYVCVLETINVDRMLTLCARL